MINYHFQNGFLNFVIKIFLKYKSDSKYKHSDFISIVYHWKNVDYNIKLCKMIEKFGLHERAITNE